MQNEPHVIAMVRCPKCGSKYDRNTKAQCPECGHIIKKGAPTNEKAE